MYTHIGVVIPTLPELQPLLAALGAEPAPQRGIWPRWQATIAEMNVTLMTSSPGLVNAAAATEALIADVAPDLLLMCGIAGAHQPDALPGDLIIAERVSAPYNGRLMPGGTIDPVFGMRWDGEVTEAFGPPTARRFDALESSPDLVRRAAAVATAWLAEHEALAVSETPPDRPARLWVGSLASADTWTRDPVTIGWMRERFNSLGEDMESAALAQVATRHEIPFLIVRCLSNNDLIAILATERKRLIYPMMAERAALVLGAIIRDLAKA